MARAAKKETVTGPGVASTDTKAVQKKKKRNAPDRPQPEWMFPPDDENPILNPKPKSEEQLRKEKEDREEAIKFLHYKSVTAPMKAAPPGTLLTLVGAFLTSYGFNSASRLYTSQCKSRKKLDAWEHELGAKLPKGFPDLVKIYKDWYKEYQQNTVAEDTSSASNGEGSGGSLKERRHKSKKTEKKVKQDETSSSGSSDGSDDSYLDQQAEAPKSTSKHDKKPRKAAKSSGSSSSSSSQSDADDEKDAIGAKISALKPNVNGAPKNLEPKASFSASPSSESESEPSSSEDEVSHPTKKSKAEESAKGTTTAKGAQEGEKSLDAAAEPTGKAVSKDIATKSSSSESSSSSGSESEAPIKKLTEQISETPSSSRESNTAASQKPATSSKPAKTTIPIKDSADSSKSTDSSTTLEVTSTKKSSTSNTSTSSSSSSSSSSDSNSSPPLTNKEAKPFKSEPEATAKRKRSLSPHSTRKAMTPNKVMKKEYTPFQRVSKDVQVDPKLASNAYVSYDYADRAHKDLSVTKGKDFTKEKNKKKRGSYRGGAIDVDGRKGIKFE